MATLDGDLVRHALETARLHGFASVRLEVGDHKFVAKCGAQAFSDDHTYEADPAEEVGSASEVVVESPCVGCFRPANPPVAPGDTVKEGDIVGSVIALGLATDVSSPSAGEVSSVAVEPDQPVEFGQKLITVRPE